MDMSYSINNMIAISNFNKGQAGQIFEDVKRNGTKIVIKNNNPECVLMSPDEYVMLMEELADAKLLNVALERLKNSNNTEMVSEEDVLKRFALTNDDLAGFEGVEIE